MSAGGRGGLTAKGGGQKVRIKRGRRKVIAGISWREEELYFAVKPEPR